MIIPYSKQNRKRKCDKQLTNEWDGCGIKMDSVQIKNTECRKEGNKMKKIVCMLMVMMLLAASMTGVLAQGLTYADTIAWDGEYDVIVIGFGGAGATAARYAALNGADVLLTEKAPEGKEGGNTRVCGQMVVTASDYETGMAYYTELAGSYPYSEAVLETFVQGIVDIRETLREEYGVEETFSARANPVTAHAVPEYPEYESGAGIDMVTVAEGISNGALWNLMRSKVMELDNIDVWFEAPGKELIQDPISKTIIGVKIEKNGKLVNLRAKNGVVLATGGFENNEQMRADYLSLPKAAVAGGLYNTGDGIIMAQAVGADMWHMNNWEGVGMYGSVSFVVPEDEHATLLINPLVFKSGSMMVVSESGERYLREDENSRHGHMNIAGEVVHPLHFETSWLICDAKQMEAYKTSGGIAERFIEAAVVGNTIDELAQAIGAEKLAETVNNYNYFVEIGVDYQTGRAAETMVALDAEGPYYALELMPTMLNTQGGPRRNENAEVLDVNGNAIPHLYAAGELGGITAHNYQGGGNMAECLIYGKIAGTNAATEKEALPVLEFTAAESNLVYTLGNDPDAVEEEAIVLAENERMGIGQGMGGDVIVKVTMDGEKIVAVEVVEHSETKGICEPAIEKIPTAIVEAQSTTVDGVSGATLTSNAIKAAVEAALAE